MLNLNDPVIIVVLLCEFPAMRNFWLTSRNTRKLGRMQLGDLSADAQLRLRWFDWYEAHGRNASLTCRHFGISRSTFYYWKKRFKRDDLRSLENGSSRPKRVRQWSSTTEQILAVKRLRETVPGMGEDEARHPPGARRA